MTELKRYTIVARRGKQTEVKKEISSGEADAWLDEFREHGWSVTTTECGTDRVVSRDEITKQWNADAAASAAKAKADRQAQTALKADTATDTPSNSDKSV